GGLAASTYFLIKYGKETNKYKMEYRYRMAIDTSLRQFIDPTLSNLSDENVLSYKLSNQRSFEIAIAATVIIYALNLLDAFVDAHLFYFNVNDNLTMRFMPTLLTNYKTGLYTPGICLTLRF
ncbi:MAG: DUF5683 domain-containing protein, partial [Bacteroidales bacterium]|nr:DUF5683 domain-containing protein [Bacteroidales bacterium]